MSVRFITASQQSIHPPTILLRSSSYSLVRNCGTIRWMTTERSLLLLFVCNHNHSLLVNHPLRLDNDDSVNIYPTVGSIEIETINLSINRPPPPLFVSQPVSQLPIFWPPADSLIDDDNYTSAASNNENDCQFHTEAALSSSSRAELNPEETEFLPGLRRYTVEDDIRRSVESQRLNARLKSELRLFLD